MPVEPFRGYSLTTFRFFEELEKNNNRAWFEAHRTVFESEILQPTRSLAAELRRYFNLEDKIDLSMRRIVSRIMRDIRQPDLPPYKTYMRLNYRRPLSGDARDWSSYPEFFVRIGKEGTDFGLGIHTVRQRTQECIRKEIIDEQEDFKCCTKGLTDKYEFTLKGEPLKYPVKTQAPVDESILPWIQQKNVYLTKHLAISHIIISDELVVYLTKEFQRLRLLYQFFLKICD